MVLTDYACYTQILCVLITDAITALGTCVAISGTRQAIFAVRLTTETVPAGDAPAAVIGTIRTIFRH